MGRSDSRRILKNRKERSLLICLNNEKVPEGWKVPKGREVVLCTSHRLTQFKYSGKGV